MFLQQHQEMVHLMTTIFSSAALQRQSAITIHYVKTELWLILFFVTSVLLFDKVSLFHYVLFKKKYRVHFAVTTKSRLKPRQTEVWFGFSRFVSSVFPRFDCRCCVLSWKLWLNNFYYWMKMIQMNTKMLSRTTTVTTFTWTPILRDNTLSKTLPCKQRFLII